MDVTAVVRLPPVPAALGVGVCLLALVWSVAPTRAEYCAAEMPARVAFARGYLFLGRLLARHPEGVQPPTWDFHVERIYAGADDHPPPGDPYYIRFEEEGVASLGDRCYPPRGLRIGHRYLISDATLNTFSSLSSVVWEVLPRGRVRLLRQYRSRNMDPRLARPTTVSDVIALMTPRAGLPATDAAPVPGPRLDLVPTVPILIGALAAFAWTWRRLSAPVVTTDHDDALGRRPLEVSSDLVRTHGSVMACRADEGYRPGHRRGVVHVPARPTVTSGFRSVHARPAAIGSLDTSGDRTS
jgi:hypothetical protein